MSLNQRLITAGKGQGIWYLTRRALKVRVLVVSTDNRFAIVNFKIMKRCRIHLKNVESNSDKILTMQ